jgi:hypothetical protein
MPTQNAQIARAPDSVTLLFFGACSHQMQNMESTWNIESIWWRFAIRRLSDQSSHETLFYCSKLQPRLMTLALGLQGETEGRRLETPSLPFVSAFLGTDRLSRRWDGGDGVLKWRSSYRVLKWQWSVEMVERSQYVVTVYTDLTTQLFASACANVLAAASVPFSLSHFSSSNSINNRAVVGDCICSVTEYDWCHPTRCTCQHPATYM